MNENAPQFVISRDYVILLPAPEKTYPIPVSDWDRMVARLKQAEDRSSYFLSVAWALFGVAATAFFSAIALPETVDNFPAYVRVLCWSMFAVTLISGFLSLKYSKQHEKDRKDYRIAE